MKTGTTTVEILYAAFGSDVIREVNLRIAEDGSLRPTLKNLNAPFIAGSENEHRALICFLHQFGITFFLNAVRRHLGPEEVARLKLEKLIGWQRAPRAETSRTTDRHDADIDSGSEVKQTGLGGLPELRPVRLCASADRLCNQHDCAAADWVDTPSYSGPERRRKSEQRGGTRDRRAQVELVFRNHRHNGRERRHLSRRASDR